MDFNNSLYTHKTTYFIYAYNLYLFIKLNSKSLIYTFQLSIKSRPINIIIQAPE